VSNDGVSRDAALCFVWEKIHDSYVVHKGKVVPVLTEVPRHEDVLGNGGIASLVLNLGTRLR